MKEPPKINTALIPESTRMLLLAAAYRGVKDFYAQPGVEERYQAWLAERSAVKKGDPHERNCHYGQRQDACC